MIGVRGGKIKLGCGPGLDDWTVGVIQCRRVKLRVWSKART